MSSGNPLRRIRENREIAGVCTGLAQHFHLPVRNVRWAFIFLALLGAGISVAVYIGLWILLPENKVTIL